MEGFPSGSLVSVSALSTFTAAVCEARHAGAALGRPGKRDTPRQT